jgi:uncharacterized membrane protein YhhN
MNDLLLFIVLSGLLHITGQYLKVASLKYIFKPLTTILIFVLAFQLELGNYSVYKILILAGLVFSLLGDVFLMLPKERFVAGLVSFLVAHLLFIGAMVSDFGPYYAWIPFVPIAIYMGVFLWILLPKTGKMTLPVLVYALVIMLFLWQAAGRAWYLAGDSSSYAFYGALLFVISDSVLAYNKFVRPFKLAEFSIMLTYWSALVLLALSIF